MRKFKKDAKMKIRVVGLVVALLSPLFSLADGKGSDGGLTLMERKAKLIRYIYGGKNKDGSPKFDKLEKDLYETAKKIKPEMTNDPELKAIVASMVSRENKALLKSSIYDAPYVIRECRVGARRVSESAPIGKKNGETCLNVNEIAELNGTERDIVVIALHGLFHKWGWDPGHHDSHHKETSNFPIKMKRIKDCKRNCQSAESIVNSTRLNQLWSLESELDGPSADEAQKHIDTLTERVNEVDDLLQQQRYGSALNLATEYVMQMQQWLGINPEVQLTEEIFVRDVIDHESHNVLPRVLEIDAYKAIVKAANEHRGGKYLSMLNLYRRLMLRRAMAEYGQYKKYPTVETLNKIKSDIAGIYDIDIFFQDQRSGLYYMAFDTDLSRKQLYHWFNQEVYYFATKDMQIPVDEFQKMAEDSRKERKCMFDVRTRRIPIDTECSAKKLAEAAERARQAELDRQRDLEKAQEEERLEKQRAKEASERAERERMEFINSAEYSDNISACANSVQYDCGSWYSWRGKWTSDLADQNASTYNMCEYAVADKGLRFVGPSEQAKALRSCISKIRNAAIEDLSCANGEMIYTCISSMISAFGK